MTMTALESWAITPTCRFNRGDDGAWQEAIDQLWQVYDAQVRRFGPTATLTLSISRERAVGVTPAVYQAVGAASPAVLGGPRMSYAVGQTVWVHDINSRSGPERGTVTRVGRRLITVQCGSGHRDERVFRIEDGRINDKYGHRWIKTEDEEAFDRRRGAAIDVLHAWRVGLEPGNRLPLVTLESLAAILGDPA
jgi:hypothetical protein